jgi:hypothetical protein
MIFTLVLLVTGCDDFLTTPPADQYTQANFWKNEEEVEAALTGVYEVLRGYSSDLILHGDVLTPNAVKFDDPGGWRSIARGEALTTNVLFESAWTSDYRGIGRANTVLANVDKANLAEEVVNKIKGEAKFLRAFFYADLLNKFGGVPLITDQPNPSQGDQGRAEENDILNQILNDLSDAASLLPEDNNPGRVTKGAALAFKARVLLYHKKWKEAAETAKKVMDLGKYSLFPDYGGLFKVQNEHNQEVIWDIEFKLPRFTNNFVDQATVHADPAPLKGLIDAYLMKDGKPSSQSSLFEPSNPYKNRDPRLYQTVRLLGSMFNGKVTNPNDVPETFIGAKKWTPYSDSTHMAEVTAGLSEINPIVIRYAGVLLIYAEAENEAVGPVQSVYDALNEIRERPSVNMPKVEPGLSQEEMRKVIRHERRIELAMEGYYYTDIRRWGIAKEVMDGPVYDFNGDVYENRSYEAPKYDLWAIPSNQIDLNPNLKQNPGW